MTEPTHVDQRRIDDNWRAITFELDAPKPARLERIGGFLHVPAHVVRVIAATPALQRSWYVSILAVVLIGLGIADPADEASLFGLLLLAPMLPVLGVALAYGTAADPSHEMQVATPMHGLRLIAIRAMTVLVVSIAMVTMLSLLGEATRPVAAAWLLPAIAATTATLALMTLRPPRQAAVIVALTWFAAVVIARSIADDPLAAFRAAGQVASLVVALAALAVTVARRARFEQLDVAS